jgi:curved DNA-binding protein CbpA
MDENDDPYQILGVPHDATPDQIKKAYRKMALKHHPDKQSNASEEDRANAGPIFVKISNAYELLSDEKERGYYDRQQGRGGGGGSSPKKNGSTRSGGGFPSQTTYTTTSSSPSYTTRTSSKPSTSTQYSANDDHHFPNNFHDPFSVFESVFREEFGEEFAPGSSDTGGSGTPPNKPSSSGDNNSDTNSNIPPEGGKQVSMSTAMKLINGKQVTVTERVFQMPDGSQQTRVNKQVNQTSPKSQSTASTPSSTSSLLSPIRKSKPKPTKTTRIVNGQKETTKVYPDGRVERKLEPISPIKKKNACFPKPPVLLSPLEPELESDTEPKPKKTIRFVNGKKEITTEYPDGRIETRMASPKGGEPISPQKKHNAFQTPPVSPAKLETNTKPRKTIKIVDGQQETTTEYPDGRIETRTKASSKEPVSPHLKHGSSGFQTPPVSPAKLKTNTPKRTIKMVNGQKETTTEYPDGRIETRTSSPKASSSTLSLSPVSIKESVASPTSVLTSRPTNQNNHGPGTTSSSQKTRIVNGQKETIIEHTITRPDGSMETRFERKSAAM